MSQCRTFLMLLALTGASGILYGGTVTTSVVCSFNNQPAVTGVNSCNSIQAALNSPGDIPGKASALAKAGYTISGNLVSISLDLTGQVTLGDVAPANVDELPALINTSGYFETSGSVDLWLQTAGTGPGFMQIQVLSLPTTVGGGEEAGGVTIMGTDCSGSIELPCSIPTFPIPWDRGAPPFPVNVSATFTGSVDGHVDNGLSAVDGQTVVNFLFTDANGNPVDVSEVPEPASLALFMLAGLLLAVLAVTKRQRFFRVD